MQRQTTSLVFYRQISLNKAKQLLSRVFPALLFRASGAIKKVPCSIAMHLVLPVHERHYLEIREWCHLCDVL